MKGAAPLVGIVVMLAGPSAPAQDRWRRCARRIGIALVASILPLASPALADLTLARQAYDKADYADAFAEFARLAMRGDAQAQRYLGTMYAQGQGVDRDPSMAYFWLSLAAVRGNAEAAASRAAVGSGLSARNRAEVEAAAGAWRPQGERPPPSVQKGGASTLERARAAYQSRDYAAALPAFERLAEQESAEAQTVLGQMYANGQGVARDDARAALWFRKAAEQGASLAQYHLGNLYREGRGVPKDAAQAASWYQKAAERGLASGQFNLALTYLHGDGVPENAAQAAYWFRKAAEMGDAAAQNNLGVLYRDGQGVPKDDGQAYFWFLLAASRGNPVAGGNRDAIEARLSAAERARAQQAARNWTPR